MGRILKQILRRLKWRSLRVILLAGSLCYLVSIFLFHARLDHDFSSSDTLYWRKVIDMIKHAYVILFLDRLSHWLKMSYCDHRM